MNNYEYINLNHVKYDKHNIDKINEIDKIDKIDKPNEIDIIINLLDILHDLYVDRNTKFNTTLSRNYQCIQIENLISDNLKLLNIKLNILEKNKIQEINLINGIRNLYTNYYNLYKKFINQCNKNSM